MGASKLYIYKVVHEDVVETTVRTVDCNVCEIWNKLVNKKPDYTTILINIIMIFDLQGAAYVYTATDQKPRIT